MAHLAQRAPNEGDVPIEEILAAAWATPAQAMDAVRRAATAAGLEIEESGPDRLTLTGPVRPYWALAAAGLLALPTLGLSLLLLKVKTSGSGTATVTDGMKGLHVRLTGRLPDFLPAVVEQLLAQPPPAPARPGASSAQVASVPLSSAQFPPVEQDFGQYAAMQPTAPARGDAATPASLPPRAQLNGNSTRHQTAPLAALNGTLTPYDGSPWAPAIETTSSVPMSEIGDINATMARPRVIDLTGGAPLLVFDDGVSVTLTRFALLGRAPSAASGDPTAQLLPIVDPELSVSKTHLAIGRDSQGLWVCDRHSTNGSSITHADGTRIQCIPGQRHYVDTGCTVQVGERSFSIAFAGIPLGRAR